MKSKNCKHSKSSSSARVLTKMQEEFKYTKNHPQCGRKINKNSQNIASQSLSSCSTALIYSPLYGVELVIV